MPETIIILDFGSQFSQLIARRVREAEVYAELLPWDADEKTVTAHDPKGIILSGGPSSVYDAEAPQLPDYLFSLGIPILGICYGMQLLVQALGGMVAPAEKREYGLAELQILNDTDLLTANDPAAVWMSHGDRIETLPEDFRITAATGNSPIGAIENYDKQIYGLQFHPEVHHTQAGTAILTRFVKQVCACSGDWTPESIIKQAVLRIRDQVGTKKVLSAVSGGVDSSVATALVQKAVGAQLSAVFVDTGLMRKNEQVWVERAFRDNLGKNLIFLDAAKRFFDELAGVTAPEQKRRIIGETFIRLFESTAQSQDNLEFLVQGTIYPDVVESSAPDRSQAQRIKTHHNVGGLPEKMDFKLVEPLRYLFKDEVRLIGEALGLPEELVWRQPFPGPGLAVRCLGEVTPARIKTLRQADAIFVEELSHAGLLRFRNQELSLEMGTAQAFAVLLPVKAVGVMGDKRTYQEVVALRAVTSEDFMTADWARLPAELLARVASRIVNEVQGVNRVVYDITSKPPGTIEWE